MVDLYNGDSLTILKKYEDNSIDLIVTDPPYRVTTSGGTKMGGILSVSNLNNGKLFKHNNCDVEDWGKELYRVQKNNSVLYVMCNQVNLQNFLNVLTSVGYKFIKSLIWYKDNKITSRYFMNQFEYILFFRKGYFERIHDCGLSDVIYVPNKKTKINNDNIHPTEKPIKLMEILIENTSNESDTVLDPFMGSGTTGVACKKLNRNFIGIEIDPCYFNIAKERIQQQKQKVQEW
jgi:site-specific DNA-methyltransferase (adenine-specific)